MYFNWTVKSIAHRITLDNTIVWFEISFRGEIENEWRYFFGNISIDHIVLSIYGFSAIDSQSGNFPRNTIQIRHDSH